MLLAQINNAAVLAMSFILTMHRNKHGSSCGLNQKQYYCLLYIWAENKVISLRKYPLFVGNHACKSVSRTLL